MGTAAEDRKARRARALDLHLAGHSYPYIAAELGVALSTAHSDVQHALTDLGEPPADVSDLVRLRIARLDAMLAGLWRDARSGNVAAIDRVLKIEAARDQAIRSASETAAESGTKPAGNESAVSEFERKLAERRAGAASARSAGGD